MAHVNITIPEELHTQMRIKKAKENKDIQDQVIAYIREGLKKAKVKP